ncbi:thioredoxin-like protein [Xylariaceae sp. FL0594]|nr:thioredoxin-like protein [Xylariaceae sp. FL0594]
MDNVYWILLAFLLYALLQAFYFNDRTPIPETSAHVRAVSTMAELRSALSSSDRAIVDFYADWCPPCRTIAPVFSRLSDELHSGQGVSFVKVNVDKVPDAAKLYGVSAMPTFLFFRDGAPAGVPVAGLGLDLDTKRASAAVGLSADGALLEQVRGADEAVLEAAARALAAESSSSAKGKAKGAKGKGNGKNSK